MFNLSRLVFLALLALCLPLLPRADAFSIEVFAGQGSGAQSVTAQFFAEAKTPTTVIRDNVIRRISSNRKVVATAFSAKEAQSSGQSKGVISKNNLPAGVTLLKSGGIMKTGGGSLSVTSQATSDGGRRLSYSVDGAEFSSVLHPFCSTKIKRIAGPYNPDQCANFAEQEVDMILMLVDLLSKGVPDAKARGFYKEIACLSRAHTEKVRGKALQVCFRRDYSKVVGQLLAKWVKPALGDIAKFSARTSSRMLVPDGFLNVTSRASTDLDAIFREMNKATNVNGQVEQSACCSKCYAAHYFPHIDHNECKKRPFGHHCCHTVCKALTRVKTGMTTSVSYCCPHLAPQPCQK